MESKVAILCSTDFFWGTEPVDLINFLRKSGCDGIILSTEPPHYFPPNMNKATLLELRALLKRFEGIVTVRAPTTDVNMFSKNPYVAKASLQSILEGINLAAKLDPDFVIVRPSYRPVEMSPYNTHKLKSLIQRIPRSMYVAFELFNSPEDLSIFDERTALISVAGYRPARRRVVGVAYEVEGPEEMRLIPGITSLKYMLLYPKRRLMDPDFLKKIVVRARELRERII